MITEDIDSLISQLECKNHTFDILRKQELPVRLHYVNHHRIDDLHLRAIDRWMVQR